MKWDFLRNFWRVRVMGVMGVMGAVGAVGMVGMVGGASRTGREGVVGAVGWGYTALMAFSKGIRWAMLRPKVTSSVYSSSLPTAMPRAMVEIVM